MVSPEGVLIPQELKENLGLKLRQISMEGLKRQ